MEWSGPLCNDKDRCWHSAASPALNLLCSSGWSRTMNLPSRYREFNRVLPRSAKWKPLCLTKPHWCSRTISQSVSRCMHKSELHQQCGWTCLAKGFSSSNAYLQGTGRCEVQVRSLMVTSRWDPSHFLSVHKSFVLCFTTKCSLLHTQGGNGMFLCLLLLSTALHKAWPWRCNIRQCDLFLSFKSQSSDFRNSHLLPSQIQMLW